MRYLLAVLIFLVVGCISMPRLPDPPPPVAHIAAKVAQEAQEAPPPAKSSQEAQQQLQQLLKTWDGIKLYSANIGQQIKIKQNEVKQLKREEVADTISAWSWWGLAISIITTAVATFLALRIGGKTLWTLVFCGVAGALTSLTAILLAPYWVAVAWSFASLLGLAVLVFCAPHLVGYLKSNAERLKTIGKRPLKYLRWRKSQ